MAQLVRTPAAALQQHFQHNIAVVVGINRYANVRALHTAEPDARYLAALLEDEAGRRDPLDRYKVIAAYDEDATCAQLTALLKTTLPDEVRRAGAATRVIFYFAGHGDAGYTDNTIKGYLFPQDARPREQAESERRLLAMDDVQKWLVELDCQHVLIILDCCSAGAMPKTFATRSALLPPPLYWETLQRYVSGKTRQAITSAAHNQQASDFAPGYKVGERDPDEGADHSPFALALFEALAADPLHDSRDLRGAGRDGVITATELYLNISDSLYRQVGESQTPGLWTLNQGHEAGDYVFLLPGAQVQLEPAPDLTGPEHDPWPRLGNQDLAGALIAASREAAIRELNRRVEAKPLVAVTGRSGSDKTSLVSDMLLPRLREGVAAGSGQGRKVWQVLPPLRLETPAPVQALMDHLGQVLEQEPGRSADDATGWLAGLATVWAGEHPHQRLLLAVDCPEALFEVATAEERARLWAVLAGSAKPDVLHIILTVPGDHWETPAQADGQSSQPLLPSADRYAVDAINPFNRDGLRQVIDQPAAAKMIFMEPEQMKDRMLDAVEGQPAALPLLTETLHRMYMRHATGIKSGRTDPRDRTLTRAYYEAEGGVEGVISDLAQGVYDQWPDEDHRRSMQHVLMRLVKVEAGQYVGGRARRADFAFPDDQAARRAGDIIAALAACGLVVQGADAAGEPYVELGHSGLITAWSQMQKWLVEQSAVWALQRDLTARVEEWQPQKPKTLLWDDDPRLPQVEATLWPAAGSEPGLWGRLRWERRVLFPPKNEPPDAAAWTNRDELAFVRASVSERSGFRQKLLGTVAAVIAILLALALFANAKRIEAIQQGNLNLARQLSAQSLASTETGGDPDLSLLLAVEAWRTENDAGKNLWQVDQALRRSLADAPLITLHHEPSPSYEPVMIIFNRDGSRLVTVSHEVDANRDGTAHLVDPTSGREIASFEGENRVAYLAFSPDGSRLVVAISDTLQLLDASSGARVAMLGPGYREFRKEAGAEGVNTAQHIVFSPDGSQLAVAISNTVHLFDGKSGQTLSDLPEQHRIDQVVYSPDGIHLLAVISDTMHIWDSVSTESMAILRHGQSVESVLFNRDGSRLAVRSGTEVSGTVHLWNSVTGKPLARIAHERRVGSADLYPEFSADGSRLIVVTQDSQTGLVYLLDASDGTPLTNPLFHSYSNFLQPRPQFSADGSLVATIVSDTVHIIHTGSLEELAVIDHGERIVDLEFSPVSHRLAIGGGHVVRVVDGASSNTEAVLAHTAPIDGNVYFSPDGFYLATVDNDDLGIHLWDIATKKEVRALRTANYVWNVVFDPNGSRFAFAEDNRVHLWDNASGKEVATLQHSDLIQELVFSPDGSRLASGSRDGMVRLWTRNGGAEPAIQELRETVTDIIPVERDYRLLAQSEDGKVHLRDIHGAEVFAFGPDDSVKVILSNVDGTRLVAQKSDKPEPGVISSTPNSTYYLLDGRTGQKLNALTVTYNISQAMFNSSRTRLALVDWYENTIHLWDAETGDEVARLPGIGPGPIRGVQFSPDGVSIARYSGSGAWVYDSETAEKIITLIEDRIVNKVQFSPDSSQLAVAMESGEVGLWDHRGAAKVAVFQHSSPAEGVMFSPDSSLLASWSADFAVRVWNTSSQQEVAVLHHPWQVLSAVFSPDNARLATLTNDGNIHLWETASGEEVGLIEEVNPGRTKLMFDADGSRLIAVNENGVIQWYHLGDAQQLVRMTCGIVSRNLTQDEWNTYRGERQSYHPTCQEQPAHASAIRAMLKQSLLTAGNMDAGLRGFRDGLNLAVLDAEVAASTRKLAAQALVEESQSLILPDRLLDALALIEEAFRYDPSFDKTAARIRLETSSTDITAKNLRQTGNELAEDGDFEAALTNYQKAEELDPDRDLDPEYAAANGAASTLADRAAELAASGQTAKAMDLLMPLVTRFPNVEFSVPNYCGGKKRGPCEVDRLIASDLEPAIKAKKLLASSLLGQASSQAANGRLEEARALFEQALELDPDLAELLDPEMGIQRALQSTVQTLLGEGGGFEKEGLHARARARYDRVIELVPEIPDAYFRRGNTYYAEAAYLPAIADYDKAIELNYPALDKAYDQRGSANFRLGSYDKAIADFRKAIEISPTSSKYYNEVCWIGSLCGQAADVLYYCDQAITLAPENGLILDSRGLARALLGDTLGAVDDFEHAVQWALDNNYQHEFIETRRAWIAALKKGINPFDSAELERLRSE